MSKNNTTKSVISWAAGSTVAIVGVATLWFTAHYIAGLAFVAVGCCLAVIHLYQQYRCQQQRRATDTAELDDKQPSVPLLAAVLVTLWVSAITLAWIFHPSSALWFYSDVALPDSVLWQAQRDYTYIYYGGIAIFASVFLGGALWVYAGWKAENREAGN